MPRYVLKRKSGAAVSSEQVGGLDGIHVIDRHDDLLMLVEAEPETMERYRAELSGWTIGRETGYETPNSMQSPTREQE
ncbi:hypothetical protein [Bradyrhizobium brasilense]|uniref:hypothetical protein n=1 Tax=Bradyrhizobium brasilense TaxID=1419277 RepID=UPI001E2CF44A|nr:hypothetical protein [Bradyrhizobium brasilense]MCC8969764.1 hypothetical protein [Bradyrhizobium brasilense]